MSLEVIQATGWYPPYGIGGTEAYVEGLAEGLARRNIRSRIILPRPAGAPPRYEHNGFAVETYPVNDAPMPGEAKGAPHQDFDDFLALLRANTGAIYHQHSWTRGLGPHHLRAARELGMKTLVTLHVPSNICLRGTMVRFGEAPCDGFIDAGRCGACWAQQRGAPRPLAHLLSHLPVSRIAEGSGRLATALGARALAVQKRRHFDEMVKNADRLVAVCQWLYDALLLNGVPPEKLSLSRQGVTADFSAAPRIAADGPLRLLYLGRWHPVKGVDIAVRAVRALPPEIPVELTLHGFAAGAEEQAYRAQIEALAAGDARIRILPSLPPGEVRQALSRFDVLLVPSQWLETGPIVVLEAQAAGLFVIGSALGGIAELVRAPGEGMLVPPADVAVWSRAIADVARRPRPLAQPRAVRSMDDAAAEMATLYEGLA